MLITSFADEDANGVISSGEFSQAVSFAKQVAPIFDLNKWVMASRELEGRFDLLEVLQQDIDLVRDMINTSAAEGKHSGIINGDEFNTILRDSKLDLYEREIDLLTLFAIRGSRRAASSNEQAPNLNIKADLINFNQFEKALDGVIKSMRKEDYEKAKKRDEEDLLDEEIKRMRKEFEK